MIREVFEEQEERKLANLIAGKCEEVVFARLEEAHNGIKICIYNYLYVFRAGRLKRYLQQSSHRAT